jgi:long-chain acyl-CoA synthetase
MTTGDLSWPLARAAWLIGDAPAVVAGERSLSYRELARRVGAIGAALGGLGERIGYLGANSLAHLEAWLVVPAFGRVFVDLNFRLSQDELAFMVQDAGVDVLVADAERLDVASRLGPDVLAEDEWDALAAGTPVGPPGCDGGALAAISYTGGTTGRPKGVMLSHENLLANARHNLIATGHTADDVWLHFCPMFHVAGTANVLACTWVGARQVVLPRFEPGVVLAAIERERATHAVFVPTMLAMLLEHPDFGSTDLSSLRHIQYAASPISPDLQRRVIEAFDCDVAQFYGMTEAAPTVSHLTPQDHRAGERLRSMGTPVPGVQVDVRGPLGEPLAPGEIGELWIRGPNIMRGYWNRPDATADVLVDGWYRSGDVAYADERGYLFMVDRAKDMIITGGENVYSIEVESVLVEHPVVREAAVFGVPHERWGEAVHAVVVLEAGGREVDPNTLIEHCRERIAGFKVPRSLEIREESLPRSGAGKVLKSTLREPFWHGRGRQVG